MLVDLLNQSAVYWEATGQNRYGVTSFAAPVVVACRWNDAMRDAIDAEGNKYVSTIGVLTSIPLALKSCVALGDDLLMDRPILNVIRSTSVGQTVSMDETLYMANI